MASIKLTENLIIEVNTLAEQDALMNMLYNNELSDLKIEGRRISLCSNPNNKPDVVYGNEAFRVIKARIGYTDNNGLDVTEIVDVWDVKRQLDAAQLTNEQGYGNFSYIDWQMEYVTIAKRYNKVKYKMYEAPKLSPENTEINVTIYPIIKNLGMSDNKMFESVITAKVVDDMEVKLFMDVTNPLDSYIS